MYLVARLCICSSFWISLSRWVSKFVIRKRVVIVLMQRRASFWSPLCKIGWRFFSPYLTSCMLCLILPDGGLSKIGLRIRWCLDPCDSCSLISPIRSWNMRCQALPGLHGSAPRQTYWCWLVRLPFVSRSRHCQRPQRLTPVSFLRSFSRLERIRGTVASTSGASLSTSTQEDVWRHVPINVWNILSKLGDTRYICSGQTKNPAKKFNTALVREREAQQILKNHVLSSFRFKVLPVENFGTLCMVAL